MSEILSSVVLLLMVALAPWVAAIVADRTVARLRADRPRSDERWRAPERQEAGTRAGD